MYLTTTDLEMGIQEEVLTVITRNRRKAEQAIADAIAEVRSYLCARYDMDLELAKTGGDRSPMVVKVVRDIALYNCYGISNPVNMPESRRDAYRDAVAYLKSVQAEHATIEGLVRLNAATGSNYVSYGGNPKKNFQY
ncbi:MAG: DUF1320 family protein [Bacteroidales bacterium]|nr:DUF1320 family protein [Bacteroidales bacterium]